jgi:hypothetical protein
MRFSISISEGLVQQARQAETDDTTVRSSSSSSSSLLSS